MAVNYYDQAAEAPILNTYVPIDFTNLYRVAATQRSMVDKAIDDLNTAVTAFGEFRSPSAVDTQNYYNLSIGQMQDLLDEMDTNPDAIKDSNWRSRLYSRLNNLDYSSLSLLKEGAEAERNRLANIAKMQQNGTYNANWDLIDVANYNTLDDGVLTEEAPVPYMTADTLSNPYYANLSKGFIKSVWQNGVRYLMKGNTTQDLEAVADAHMNDLIATPQGRMYMRDFLIRNGGDEEAARKDFRDMIVASQMDRTLRPELEVDPAWLASIRANGTKTSPSTTLNRRDLLKTGLNDMTDDIFLRYSRANMTPEEIVKYYRDSADTREAREEAHAAYLANPNDETRKAYEEADKKWKVTEYGPKNAARQKEMLDAFYEHSGGPDNATKFHAEDDRKKSGYSRAKYKYGVQAGLDAVSVPIDINKDDRLLTQVGGVYDVRTNSQGVSEGVFSFKTSSGFLLPETIFSGLTGVEPREQNRAAMHGIAQRDEQPLSFQEFFEGGNFRNIQFTPSSQLIETGSGQAAVKGTIKIPVDEVNKKVGTGWSKTGFSVFGRESTERALNQLYGAQIVKEPVGNGDVKYYEFTGYRLLAPWNSMASESNVAVDQSWMNTSTYGGIGTGTLTTNNYDNAVMNALIQ